MIDPHLTLCDLMDAVEALLLITVPAMTSGGQLVEMAVVVIVVAGIATWLDPRRMTLLEAPVSADLVARLTASTAEAIANERPTLGHSPEQVKGITLELELSRSGDVVEAMCYVQCQYRLPRAA